MINELNHLSEKFADHVADYIGRENDMRNIVSVINAKDCLVWAKEMREKFSDSCFLMIQVKKNETPYNENDLLTVTLAMLDEGKNPVRADGTHGVSTQMRGKTIDTNLIKVLNGGDSVILKM